MDLYVVFLHKKHCAASTKKYPKMFKESRKIPKKTRCAELLQQIKESDPHASYGEIIRNALLQEEIRYPWIFNFLGKIDDKKFEKLLSDYLKSQNKMIQDESKELSKAKLFGLTNMLD